MPESAPYGTWTSPISAADVARAGASPSWVRVVGDEVWWTESRPEEGGRVALIRWGREGVSEEVLAAPWNVRNRVHEYGGMPWTALPTRDGHDVVFTHWDDQRIYRYDADQPERGPRPITPSPPVKTGLRYADLVVGPGRDEIWCLRETVTGPAPTDVRRHLVAVPVDGRAADGANEVRELAASHHFMTGPRISPDGGRVAWIGWDHPRMPWDGTELCVAPIDADRSVGAHRVVAGGPSEAVVQAEWVDPWTLYLLTDASGWWNLHRITLNRPPAINLCQREEEFGGPLWRLGMSWFAVLSDGRVAVVHGTDSMRLGILDPRTGQLHDVAHSFTDWYGNVSAAGTTVAGVAGTPTQHDAVVRVRAATGTAEALGPLRQDPPDSAYLPRPEIRLFPGEGGREVHGFVYRPRNPDFVAPEGELPPYVVFVHGGPTGRTRPTLNLTVAYFTSRGIGVVDVNYGGSAGYGRAYRERLREQWGIVDVEDCAAAARGVVAAGLADPDRLAIRGGSAGGWTTAASVASVDLYGCGVMYYPVLELVRFRTETHDFESRYLEGLIGPWPQAQDRYVERSPVTRASQVSCPILLLQGLEDEICPPSQCELLLDAIKGRGLPHAYLTFAGEQHGFRKAESVTRALEAELSTYGQVFGFEPPGVPRLS